MMESYKKTSELDSKLKVITAMVNATRTDSSSTSKRQESESNVSSDQREEVHSSQCVNKGVEKLYLTPLVPEAGPTIFGLDQTPCIRMIVMSSSLPDLTTGTLFIVTCTGGTIGREGNNDVLISDPLVSKTHCKFGFVEKNGIHCYEVIDVGSENGTFLNGRKLSDSFVESAPMSLFHGNVITVGRTDLLCHIHPQDEKCEDCTAGRNFLRGPSTVYDKTLKQKNNP